MKIATWNVNSITSRKERLLAFLERERPDVLCLQELKCIDENFPFGEIKDAGYHAVSFGQKTYNGVALLSKAPIENVVRGWVGAPDEAARLIGGTIAGVEIFSVYVPNGQEVGSDKFQYKIKFLASLRKYLAAKYDSKSPFVLAGDFNIAPEARDVHDAKAWHGKVLCSEAERRSLANLASALGLEDTFRVLNQEREQFTWWDYRAGGFERNHGLRIDLILASAPVAGRLTQVGIDREERRGEKPSDHAPVWIEIK